MERRTDGILYFKHDEQWAKKRLENYLKRKLVKNKLYKNNFCVENVKKLYVPFCDYTISGNVHSFISFHSIEKEYNYDWYYERNIDKTIEEEVPEEEFKKIKHPIGSDNFKSVLEDVAAKSCHVFMSTCRECNSNINYTIDGVKNYYFPVWIIETSLGGIKKEYYINDQNGKVAGEIIGRELIITEKDILILSVILIILFPIITYISISTQNANLIMGTFVGTFLFIGIIMVISYLKSSKVPGFKPYDYVVLRKKYKKRKRYWFDVGFKKAKEKFLNENRSNM